jgi:hypothetical protein
MAASTAVAVERAGKREAAAEYIKQVTGCVAVPHGSDPELRAALADGVLLCRALNAGFPRAVPEVRREQSPCARHAWSGVWRCGRSTAPRTRKGQQLSGRSGQTARGACA